MGTQAEEAEQACPDDALPELTALAEALPLHGSRDDLLATVAQLLPRRLADHRVEIGVLHDHAATVDCYLVSAAHDAEPLVTTCSARAACLTRVREAGHRIVVDLEHSTDPHLRALHDRGMRQRLIVPITLGATTVGVLAVTSRSDIRPDAGLAALTAAVLSSRAHRLVSPAQGEDAPTLEAQLAHLRATARLMERTDALTRLPNRAAAFTAIGEARSGEGHGGAFAFIDLDHLKMTNDRLGHGSGDSVLQHVADRLRDLGQDQQISVYRLGGDEFGALSEGPAEELRDALETLATDLAERPVHVGGHDVPTAFSAGVCAVHGHDHGIEEIVSRAESAAYEAKRAGRGRILVHIPSEDGRSDTHSEMRRMDAVREAVVNGRLTMVAQPIASLVDGREAPMDAEVLVRLVDDEGRTLLPDDFVVLAEQYDVVNALDRAVLARVVATLAAGSTERRISCNVSPHSMIDPDFVDWASDLISSAGQGDRLVLELTERLPVGTTEAVRGGMNHLARSGVHFALDDFGAGTTSYGNLRELPIDVLKIDGVLVRGCLTSAVDMAMLRATVSVADALGIRAIAEGVETADQLAAVAEVGAHSVQGYYFGQPLPWPAVTHP